MVSAVLFNVIRAVLSNGEVETRSAVLGIIFIIAVVESI